MSIRKMFISYVLLRDQMECAEHDRLYLGLTSDIDKCKDKFAREYQAARDKSNSIKRQILKTI